MTIRNLLSALLLTLAVACSTPPQAPPSGSDSGTSAVVTVPGAGACTLLDGIDSSGVLRTLCVDTIEVGMAVAFILTLRSTIADAGTNPRIGNSACVPLQSICATSSERAAAILFLSSVRDSKLKRDAGFP